MAKIFFPGIGRKSNIGGKKSKLWNFNFLCNEKNDEIFFRELEGGQYTKAFNGFFLSNDQKLVHH